MKDIESGGLPPVAPEMAVDAGDTQIEKDEIAKRVYEIVYTTDKAFLNTLVKEANFRSDFSKLEALEFIRDQIMEMVVRSPAKDGWQVFLTDKARRGAVYRNLLIDLYRKSSKRRVSYIDDHVAFDEEVRDGINTEQKILSKLDLLRIVNSIKTKPHKLSVQTLDRFLIIFYGLIEGKTAREINEENDWNITEVRIGQIFRAGANVIRKEYPLFPCLLTEFNSILEDKLSDDSKTDTVRHLLETLKIKENELLRSLEECPENERKILEDSLACVRCMLDPDLKFDLNLRHLRQTIWRKLFSNKVYEEWYQSIRRLAKEKKNKGKL